MRLINIQKQDGTIEEALQIDGKFAICSDPERNGFTYLFSIEPTEDPETFVSAFPYNHIVVAGAERTHAGFERIANSLKEMSAYTLLTEHFHKPEAMFFVDRLIKNQGLRRF